MSSPTLERVQETFTEWAPRYDPTRGWSTQRYRREAVLALGLRRGDRVLDLACSAGLRLPDPRQLVGSEGHVTGVEVTPAMLDIARQRVARHGWDNLVLREADAAHLPFPDASFDEVICSYAMSIIPNYAGVISEARRVLAPGGRFAVLDVKLSDSALSRLLNPLFLRMGHICALDVNHPTIDHLRRAFAEVRVREYQAGFLYVAVATKG